MNSVQVSESSGWNPSFTEPSGVTESALTIEADGYALSANLHKPFRYHRRAIVLVVGGPQYRVGAQRQHVLLARYLAARGYCVLRFDFRGMGDSTGRCHPYTDVKDDLRSAVDRLQSECSAINEFVLWGLCDGASAAIMCTSHDPRISGVVMVNPWVESASGSQTIQLRHYYSRRLMNFSLWRKLLQGKVPVLQLIVAALRSAMHSLAGTWRLRSESTIDPVVDALKSYSKQLLIVLSDTDITAREFEECTRRTGVWKALRKRKQVTVRRHKHADHTFSSSDWQRCLEQWTEDWLDSWPSS